ncbi:flagellar basal-body rod protein FlgG [Candidatus Sumerlaeota bacterium]|nr:flagellar basal-body rod protein FlgG [Candidatus Sumerlaeota bacterium]
MSSTALFTASSGMKVQEYNVQTIAHNLANVNTTGYKKQRAEFQDLLYQTIQAPGGSASSNTTKTSGIEMGLGAKVAGIQRVFTQGSARSTDRQLDVMIEGDGFFRVNLPDGTEVFTRDGALETDADGQLTTIDGDPLADGITIPSDAISITIGQDGTVSVLQAGQTATSQVGQIQLVRFSNPSGLQALGHNLYVETGASGDPLVGTPGEDGLGSLSQGFLELSNVEVVDELVNMITAQRAYEVNSKAITTSEEMLQTASNLKR